ncbi:MAG: VCBS repeat-containing protein [Candidatus Eremiobacteraeota bacterium]|nr:VCBS repeat-containing protein [Candidatus Eremiobacteraeota bacterium]
MRKTLSILGLGLTLAICGCGNEDPDVVFPNNFNQAFANGLLFSTQATAGAPNTNLNNFQVQFVNGNQAVPVQGPITLTLSTNPTNAVLGGTTQVVSTPNGTADFSNLTISKKGVYRITASAPGVAPVTSLPIVIGGGAVTAVKTSSVTNPSALNGGIFSVHSGDLNNDGNLDLVASFFDDSLVAVYLGNGTGGFAAPTNRTLPGLNPNDFTLGDWNRDGRLDLAVPSSLADTMVIYLGDGSGGFAAPTSINVGLTPVDAATGDFNGDGNPDLVTANFDGGTLSILRGNGTGAFPTVTSLALTAGTFANRPSKVLVTDFNADGRADIVVTDGVDAATSNNQAQVFLGNGDGTFGAATVLNTGTFPRGLAAADFNGDGRIDFVTANRNSNNLSVFLNNGAGFAAAANFTAGTNPNKVSAVDVNLDGRIDLVTTNSNGGNASILLGNGNGTFAAATNLTTTSASPTGLDVGDYNKDSVPDFAIGNFTSAGFPLDIFLQTP